jgi:hypothetical protein
MRRVFRVADERFADDTARERSARRRGGLFAASCSFAARLGLDPGRVFKSNGLWWSADATDVEAGAGRDCGPSPWWYGTCTVHHRRRLMDTQLMWLMAAAVVLVVIVALFVVRRQRSERLRQRFGPEYERTVRDAGDVRKAEAVLQSRAARVARLHIRPLAPEEAQRFSAQWSDVQAQFVDDPRGAVTQADRLVGEVMHARGYPVGEFEQRVEDISVDHPNVVMNYRAARAIAEEHARGGASTEDLRQAMVHYRALYAELLGQTPVQTEAVVERAVAAGRGRR